MRFSPIMGILVCQVLHLLACEAAIRVEDCVFIRCIGKHALFFAMSTFYFLQTLFDACWSTRLIIHVSSDTEIRAAGWANNTTGTLMRATLIVDLSCKTLTLSLAINAHILWSIRRLSIRNCDGVAIRFAGAHGASIKVGTVTLSFCLLQEVLFEFLIS